MRRMRVIVGIILITAVVLVWQFIINELLPLTTVRNAASSVWSPSYWTWMVLVFGWYALCWIHTVKEWDRRPVLLFGRYVKTAGPGLVFIEPLLYTTLPDVRVQDVVREIKVPSVQTKDNVSVGIEAMLTYRVDATKVKDAVVEVQDVNRAIEQRALSTINDMGSVTDLDHFLEHRNKFGDDVVAKLRERVTTWGVTIHALELKAFKINDSHVEQAIAMKARAQKEAAAELTRAEMQKQIASALNEAAKTYDENGRWLKGMETLIEMTRSANNNTILIPTDVQAALGALARIPGVKSGSVTELPKAA